MSKQKEGIDILVKEYLLSRGFTKAVDELEQQILREQYEQQQQQFQQQAQPQIGDEPAEQIAIAIVDPTEEENSCKRMLSSVAEDVYVLGIQNGNRNLFFGEYDAFRSWALNSIEIAQAQLLGLSFPLFVHCYIGMIRNGFEEESRHFMETFSVDFRDEHLEEVQLLSMLTATEQYRSKTFIDSNLFIKSATENKFVVRMGTLSYNLLALYLVQNDSVVLASIINNKITFRKYEDADTVGPIIPRLLVDLPGYTPGATFTSSDFHSISLGVPGTAPKSQRKVGMLPAAAARTITLPMTKDDAFMRDMINKIVRPKKVLSSLLKRKRAEDNPALVDQSGQQTKVAENTTEIDPILEYADKLGSFSAEANAQEVGGGSSDRMGEDEKAMGDPNEPSIIYATITNAYEGLTCLDISSNLKQLASGYRDSSVRVWRFNPDERRHFGSKFGSYTQKSNGLSFNEVLPKTKNMIIADDRQSKQDNLFESDDSEYPVIEFRGHSKPVYGVSIDASENSDERLVLSCSADETIRLWDTSVLQCVGKYQCSSPSWDVEFGPLGYLFASANQDKTATIYATDRVSPLRLMIGHVSDVNCVTWHGNAEIIGTGSDDRTARLWDIRANQSVRLLQGSLSPLSSIAFSPLGNLLSAGSENGSIYVWDLSSCRTLAVLQGHEGTVHGVSFCANGTTLISGGDDCSVRVWDLSEVYTAQAKLNTVMSTAANFSHLYSSSTNTGMAVSIRSFSGVPNVHAVYEAPQIVVRPRNSFFTKCSPVFHVGCSNQNLVYAGGPFSYCSLSEKLMDTTKSTMSSHTASEKDTVSALGLARAIPSIN